MLSGKISFKQCSKQYNRFLRTFSSKIRTNVFEWSLIGVFIMSRAHICKQSMSKSDCLIELSGNGIKAIELEFSMLKFFGEITGNTRNIELHSDLF